MAEDLVLERVLLDNPLTTPALVVEQRRLRPFDPSIGRIVVERNAKSVIGGLAFVRSRLHHHEMVAEWLRNTYELVYGGQPSGIAAGDVRVDKSTTAHDNGMAARVDRGRKLHDYFIKLGPIATNMLIAVIVMDQPVTEMAPTGPSGRPGGRARARWVKLLLGYLDTLAEWEGLISHQKP